MVVAKKTLSSVMLTNSYTTWMTYLARDYASWTNMRKQHPQTHKNNQTDQIGDGFGQHKSAKGPQKAQQDQEDYETRKEHSNSGSNTNKGTGMDYVDRKNAHGGNDVQRRREDGNQPTGQHGSVS
ncbi:hypothetical protein N0V86_008471 [Didymella sp. IMI 355093]|nr:hypothetical protein N0V86_008471 [Didymella sp. IMI 355093]